jgi:hypothetical protein
MIKITDLLGAADFFVETQSIGAMPQARDLQRARHGRGATAMTYAAPPAVGAVNAGGQCINQRGPGRGPCGR